MKKINGLFLTIFLIAVFPISYLAVRKYANFDNISAVFFLLVIIFLVIKNRKRLDFQKMLSIGKVPLVYAVLWRTKFGLGFMDKISSKYREIVKLLGYCFIGFGFFGLLFISINVLVMLFNLFVTPKETSQSVALLLPLTNIPGLGYLSFWHFLITIFITVLVHEFAHGIVARAHNLPVKSSGLGAFSVIIPLVPLAFVEPDEKKLTREKDIVQYSVFSAGPMANIILAFAVMLLLSSAIIPMEEKLTYSVGFSFNGLMEDYPAKAAGMQQGMIINNANGKEVLTYQDFKAVTGDLKPMDKMTVSTTTGKTFALTAKAAEGDPSKGFIGITDIRNERKFKPEFEGYSTVFIWVKDLIKWLMQINLIVGLMNLLPIIITDGGRMLKIALDNIFNDEQKSRKVWSLIGLIFIFTLISALLIKHGLQLFSFIGIG